MQQRKEIKVPSSAEDEGKKTYQGCELKRPRHKVAKKTDGMILKKRVVRVVKSGE